MYNFAQLEIHNELSADVSLQIIAGAWLTAINGTITNTNVNACALCNIWDMIRLLWCQKFVQYRHESRKHAVKKNNFMRWESILNQNPAFQDLKSPAPRNLGVEESIGGEKI